MLRVADLKSRPSRVAVGTRDGVVNVESREDLRRPSKTRYPVSHRLVQRSCRRSRPSPTSTNSHPVHKALMILSVRRITETAQEGTYVCTGWQRSDFDHSMWRRLGIMLGKASVSVGGIGSNRKMMVCVPLVPEMQGNDT